MPRQSTPEGNPAYQEVPMIIYVGGKRVRIGMMSIFGDGIAGHFDEKTDDSFAKAIIDKITAGAVNALSIVPTPEREPTLADYIKERPELCPLELRPSPKTSSRDSTGPSAGGRQSAGTAATPSTTPARPRRRSPAARTS